MFDSLMPLLFVAVLLIWLLDFLGVLEIGAVFVALIGGVITAVVRLATWSIRRLAGTSQPQS